MPIWGQVELLCRAIAEEGQKEADRIFSAGPNGGEKDRGRG